ncbi:hypothetical protein LOK49_LG13G00604 [Camellia lanceoleosa]|uniref:Uncharacterized protein n=1 Tax=Camellia lanceoleosa TaxID=1840588 RepID=A0ACC0FJE5_9ERIC|nr:hypothetical protein LOK49_LG13G00604 [Camellia lanceoleosa]
MHSLYTRLSSLYLQSFNLRTTPTFHLFPHHKPHTVPHTLSLSPINSILSTHQLSCIFSEFLLLDSALILSSLLFGRLPERITLPIRHIWLSNSSIGVAFC